VFRRRDNATPPATPKLKVPVMPKKSVRMVSVNRLEELACEGLYGCRWYRDATAQIDHVSWLEGWDRDEFAGVLATTSPRCSVVRNIRMSLHFMKHRDLRVVPMKGIRTSVTRFLYGKGIAGPKTSAFYHNLSGRYEYVTLDVWMAYALGIDQKDFNTVANRAKAISRVVTVGERLGIAPAEAQAAIWAGIRGRAGRNHSPFSVASEYLAARDRKWDIEGCSLHGE
jgi:hypothetical protein